MTHAVSPTQISNYRACARKIAWQFVAGIKPKQHKSAELGDKVHKCLERYLKYNQRDYTDKSQEILDPALQFLPKPGECSAEEKFKFEWDGLLFTGRIDAKTHLRVFDLKTTKDAKYAKTPETLAADPQGILYSKATGIPDCRWVYTLTGPVRKAWPVDFTPKITGPDVDSLLEDGKKIRTLVEQRNLPLSLPPNTNSCGDYGGCAYLDYCTDLSPLRNIFRNKMGIDLLSKLEPKQQELPKISGEHPMDPPFVPAITIDYRVAINPPESAESGPPPVPEPEAPKTKRPRKTSVKVEAPLAAPIPEEKPAAVSGVPEMAASTGTQVPLSIAYLFIDSLPEGKMGADVFDLAIAIDAVEEALRKDGVQNYRFLEFGQGAGVIAAKTIEYLADLEASKKGELLLYADSRLPESKLVIGTLRAKAVVTVRGI